MFQLRRPEAVDEILLDLGPECERAIELAISGWSESQDARAVIVRIHLSANQPSPLKRAEIARERCAIHAEQCGKGGPGDAVGLAGNVHQDRVLSDGDTSRGKEPVVESREGTRSAAQLRAGARTKAVLRPAFHFRHCCISWRYVYMHESC